MIYLGVLCIHSVCWLTSNVTMAVFRITKGNTSLRVTVRVCLKNFTEEDRSALKVGLTFLQLRPKKQ